MLIHTWTCKATTAVACPLNVVAIQFVWNSGFLPREKGKILESYLELGTHPRPEIHDLVRNNHSIVWTETIRAKVPLLEDNRAYY